MMHAPEDTHTTPSSTALLGHGSNAVGVAELPLSSQDVKFDTDVPVPWLQLLPLYCFCIADALTYAVVFPFISDMVTSFGVPEDKIGLYAGMGEGVMMLVEAIFAPFWAWMADRYGRRPTLIAGCAILVLVCPLVGFSTSVWQIVLWRACLGLNSSAVVVKIATAELSHPSNRAKMFASLSPSFSVGLVLGTFIGGHFAHPFERLPSYLGGTSQFWRRHPYALPCLIIAALDALVVLVGLVLLVETRRPTSESPRNNKRSTNRFARALRVPGFTKIMAVFVWYQVATFSWDGMFTVFAYAQPEHGGLGLPVDIIGVLFSANYLIAFAMNPILLPRMQKRWGTVLALGIVLAMWPAVAAMIPLTQWTAVNARSAMWAVLLVQLSFRAVGAFGWAMCDIIMMSCFDNYPDLLATASAINLMNGASGRALGPAMAGWLFSISTQYPTGSFLRQISWIYMVAVSIPAVLLARMLRSGPPRTIEEGMEGEREGLLEATRGSNGRHRRDEAAERSCEVE